MEAVRHKAAVVGRQRAIGQDASGSASMSSISRKFTSYVESCIVPLKATRPD